MEVQIKQEADSDDEGPYPTPVATNIQMVVKKEELIIEDTCEANYNNENPDQEEEYHVDGYSIHFMDGDGGGGGGGKDLDNEDYSNECSDNDVALLEDASNDLSASSPSEDEAVEQKSGPKKRQRRKKKQSEIYVKVVNLLHQNTIRILCPICKVAIQRFGMWSKHITHYHSQFAEEIKSNYEYLSTRTATCKICSLTSTSHANHFLHYLSSHSSVNNVLFVCKLCKLRVVDFTTIVEHMNENHKTLKVTFTYCPIPECNIQFPEKMLMKLHFMDIHNREFKTKFGFFNCALCNHPKFDKENQFFDHLMNLHGLCDYNWKLLHFSQVCLNGEKQFECLECSQKFVDTEGHKRLEHYLSHKEEFVWFCRYCQLKLTFKDTLHFCTQMYIHFSKVRNQPSSSSNVPPPTLLSTLDIPAYETTEWRAFEAYIMHVCPFCGNDFNTFTSWQLHLRQTHLINSLKGLRLSIMESDSKKYVCIDCGTGIEKSSKDIHTHRFQHLPHFPYTCLKCAECFRDLETAVEHFQKQCGDDDSISLQDDYKSMKIPKLCDDELNWIEIFCSMCKKIKRFPAKEDIEKHFRDSHNNFISQFNKSANNIDMVCRKCKTTIRSVSNEIYLNHYIKHLGDGPYRCLMCQRSYTGLDICRRHVRRFHNMGIRMKKKYEEDSDMPENVMKGVKRRLIKSERKSTTPTSSGSGNQQDTINNGLGTLSSKSIILNEFVSFIGFACPECNQLFDTHTAWNEHISKEHTFFNLSEVSVYDAASGRHKCLQCSRLLDSSMSHRQKHKLNHMPHRAFICTLCESRCKSLDLIYGHLRRNHFRKGTFECPICLVNLTTSYERSVHVKRAHPRSEWPETMCSICYQKYSSLASHMLSHDVNRPKKICPVCGTGIVTISDLKKHIIKKHNVDDPSQILAKANLISSRAAASKAIKMEEGETTDTSSEISDGGGNSHQPSVSNEI
ncbi:zinc finger protein 493-like [Musca domestica]|uniref:Zinc finger protein 493-like n=1 Tax=Musca domestica TaxID=7370 RepID=A0ABM3VNC9_MUSDO|nr:zinc finger protein 493-like [Musca domestica]